MSFALRRGVCQDFAHIMIAGLRGLGLPAAYVSGYLRTSCGPERPRLEGSDAMHAWVNVWCGAKIGWLGLDPTNAVAAGNDHIVLAIGRDNYADVAPVDGVILASGGQHIDVAVGHEPPVARAGPAAGEPAPWAIAHFGNGQGLGLRDRQNAGDRDGERQREQRIVIQSSILIIDHLSLWQLPQKPVLSAKPSERLH